MKEFADSVLRRWLEIEYYAVANKTKFISRSVEVNYALVADTVRCLDYMTTMVENCQRNYVITIIALMWEHLDKSKYEIKNFALRILTRIGYPTSAIILDDEYLRSSGKFFRPNSVLDMFTLALEHQRNEVVINEQSFLLTDFQKSIWDAMDTNKVIGISAPTSAGKSFVLLLKTISRLVADQLDIAYIIPTLSLQNQVTEDYHKMFKKLGIDNCRIVNSFIPDTESSGSIVYVLTQEKALSAFLNEGTAFSKKLILVVDEIQNIERIQYPTDLRAKILYDTLVEFRQKNSIEQIIISGPRIDSIDNLGEKIFVDATLELKTLISPVLNLTYSISKVQDDFYLKQYCALIGSAFLQKIGNASYISGYGQKQYTAEYLSFLKEFISNIGDGNQNIVFAPTSKTAKDIAVAISSNIIYSKCSLDDLIKYYEDTISARYAMCATLQSGVAYHHGKLPMHVRRTLEKAIADKKIRDVVCTTTLMQGVNMPAQNVIVRNPHLYTKKSDSSAELSSYEMANLRGRAGRLLKDFVGRTFVLDESSFEGIEEYDQMSLFNMTIPLAQGVQFSERT